MKNWLITICLMMQYFCTGQSKSSVSNIFSTTYHTFNNGLNDVFYTNDKGDIINFTKYYSNQKLKTGDLDSLSFKMLDTIKAKYVYYVRDEAFKDTLKGEYIYKRQQVVSTINMPGYRKIIFKKFNSFETNFECFEALFDNVKVIKRFVETFAIVQYVNKKYKLLLFNEACKIVNDEDFSVENMEFYEDKNFLVVKEKNKITFIFDRYIVD